ncbi:recombination-associated protein RdgC [Vibrio cholerae]|uniref:recombination-associated protein RdgC n=1 Tax=Vibrio cholerae TaxID=666 RepID=UPI0004E30EDE|nr:recombination-associated protein RdgC [Vibrio cholerae]EGR2118989.1 hypothetical protein [Vibrio cholerae]KFE28725.1 exonuclease, RdgC family protein [Vibrio cholerae]MVC37472.1 hypothetical protein [Vibrio cholerae]TXY44113.1 hypothetical protein FXE84_01865 [Vibrio cholerae]HBN6882534.1 recombination-associated protein RdgC [Vibrio cholerae]
MIINRVKEYSIGGDLKLMHSTLEEIAKANPAKKTSGTVQESIGFSRIFDDLDPNARYFEFIGGQYLAKIIHETRVPSKKDIDRELARKKMEMRKADPEIKFTRSKITEIRKEVKNELRAVTAPTVNVFYLVLQERTKKAWISCSSKKDSERLMQFLGQANIRLMEEELSVDIESDLTAIIGPEAFLGEDWELGQATSLTNLSDKSKVSYASQDLSSSELGANTEKEKKAVEIELIYKTCVRLRINANQALTNIKLLQKDAPEWLNFSSEQGEEASEIDVIRAHYQLNMAIIDNLYKAVHKLIENIGSNVIGASNSEGADLEFTTMRH